MDQHGIPLDNPDMAELQLSGCVGKEFMAIFKLNPVLRIGQHFIDGSRHFNRVFFGH